MEAYKRLRRRHQRFVDEFVLCGIGSEAMVNVGFKGRAPATAASKLRARPEIQQAIEECIAQAALFAGLTRGQVLRDVEELKQRCMQQVRPVLNRKGEQVYVQDRDGNEVAAYAFDAGNAMRALEFQGKVLKMLTDLHEHTGKNGGPIRVSKSADDLTDEELAAIAARGRPTPAEPETGSDE